jgi:hypothetical protein
MSQPPSLGDCRAALCQCLVRKAKIEKDDPQNPLSGIGLISNAGARFEAPETISAQGRLPDRERRAI